MNDNPKKKVPEEPKKEDLPGYPAYPEDEDIYQMEKKEVFPEDEVPLQKGLASDRNSDNELDVPGAELDDEMEDIGEEDEENNYYSLGGDSHSDLDEN